MVEIRGVKVKTCVSEMTLKEYEDFLHSINDKENTRKQMFLRLLNICGMKEANDLMQVNSKDVEVFINGLNKSTEVLKEVKFNNTIEIGNSTYTAFESDYFMLSFKDEAEIEKAIQTKDKWLVRAMAILFKDDRLSWKEHYTEAHLKHKENLFSELNALFCVPYLLHIQKALIKNKVEEKDVKEAEQMMELIEDARVKDTK